jgi:hypothetical protein
MKLEFRLEREVASLHGGRTVTCRKRAEDRTVAETDRRDAAQEEAQLDDLKGKVSGAPVGCACGDGVIDWR